jgi:hypothetical protein
MVAEGAQVFAGVATDRRPANVRESDGVEVVTVDYVVFEVSESTSPSMPARVAVTDDAEGVISSCGGPEFMVGESYLVVARPPRVPALESDRLSVDVVVYDRIWGVTVTDADVTAAGLTWHPPVEAPGDTGVQRWALPVGSLLVAAAAGGWLLHRRRRRPLLERVSIRG